ncbi:hypothetical protein NEOC65_001932 [Neochlamydia sp. AcF65]|nr:hypothetical protein [Neochlamydia sp. AcF65]MBS4166833.1 hypothetical protein [Neochlamydia sp. AcF65]
MMLRENHISEEHKVGNIEACMRGRSTRSSEEAFVMKGERRG